MKRDVEAAAAASPLPSAGQHLAGFMLLSTLVGTSNGLSRISLPLFAAALHAQAWQIGLVGGLGFAGMLLLSLPMGAWIDRHGSRPLFRLGTAVAATLYLLALTRIEGPWTLIACAVALGLCVPFRMVTTQTEFLHLVPRLNPAQAGWNRASHTLGMFFVGPSLGALLVGAIGFAPTFALVGAVLLATFAIGSRVLSTAPPGRGAAAEPLVARLRSLRSLLAARPELRRTMRIEFCGQLALSNFSVFIVLFAVRVHGMSLPAAAGLVSLQGALFVLTLLAGGWLVARWTDAARYLLSFTLMLAQAVLLAFAPGAWALWCGAALLGLGLGLQQLATLPRFAALMQELGRGRVGGIFSLAGPAGGLVGATAGGLLGQHHGLDAGFKVLVAVYLLLWLSQWRRVRRAAA